MNLATPWQQRTFQRVLGVLHGGRLAHGLLICGPEMLGKQALMRVLIARLLCTETQGFVPKHRERSPPVAGVDPVICWRRARIPTITTSPCCRTKRVC